MFEFLLIRRLRAKLKKYILTGNWFATYKRQTCPQSRVKNFNHFMLIQR